MSFPSVWEAMKVGKKRTRGGSEARKKGGKTQEKPGIRSESREAMSNPACADLYMSIIEDVIVESRQDFENAGIDEQTLQDLRDIWRQRLLASKVAAFPWGDSEEQEQEPAEGGNENTDKPDGGETVAEVFGTDADDESKKEAVVGIKEEDAGRELPGDSEGVDINLLATPGLNQNDGLVEVPAPEMSKTNNNSTKNRSKSKTKKRHFKKGMMPTVTFSIRNNQLDGSFDYGFDDDDINHGERKPGAGGAVNGTANTHNNDNRHNDDNDDDDDDDDDDDLGSDLGADSDAINSDLDDEDDEDDEDGDGNGDDPDGDGTGNDIEQNIMLCLYDRVQRVRNRWKCSLKDGLMNINGKDYVFQKASGDSEW